jgi:hypothetical protein
MDYPYENLSDDKFQEFAQALLAKDFPDIQCFPVAQPDGGRDIVTYEYGTSSQNFNVYQVKYVRKPFAVNDLHKWLLEIIKGEAPKVKKLIEKGAKQFYLITNVSGTAHLDVGSIDKMNQILEDKLGIPSRCWWRDDLNRKLDNDWNLKWTYPELMTGSDLIRVLIEAGLSEDQDRRASAIRAFVVEQFNAEQVVKFKQVDLQNRLIDLFIDVPALPPQNAEHIKQLRKYHDLHDYISYFSHESGKSTDLYNEQRFLYGHRSRGIGAASLLLNSRFQREVPFVVLEGAPGQGKSTITQYLCQIHRMRLLGEDETKRLLPDTYKDTERINAIAPQHKKSHVCLPFRVDLRDLAAWLSGNNPFSVEQEKIEAINSTKSLEQFLAFLVKHYSGGLDFSANDLLAIFKKTNVLLVFDGLDEVADIEKRREVVNTIQKGSQRLKANVLSLQVIVTSRPAAFANSPGLPENEFPRYYLDSLNKPLIDEYANKWMNAKNLNPQDRSEVKKILKDKLDQPHLKDLAKNPMQLTILLSLIHNRGSSLPDKRTALYDSYVDHFFNREAEKTSIVKKYRDLLLDIHKYIAWVLHSEAEQGGNGSITQTELHSRIQQYLEEQGHNVDLASELVLRALERIVALVSRVEGTYEFEVQPLREYFAARYLYETARHSSPGKEYSGTRPDRFDAIARNFYWLNVTRFYAGCYDVGELSSLIDRLEELIDSDGYNLISHPRILAATLLSDWVFSQHPKSMKKVIKLILDGIGLRYILPSASRRVGQNEPMVLPSECGREELIKHCFSLLKECNPLDFARDIIDLILSNSPSFEEIYSLWENEISIQTGKSLSKWLEYGLYLGILGQSSRLSVSKLSSICSECPQDQDLDVLTLIYKAGRFDYFESNEATFKSGLEIILNIACIDNQRQIRRQKSDSILEITNSLVDASRYALSFRERRPTPLVDLWKTRLYFREDSAPMDDIQNLEASRKINDAQKCLNVINIVKRDSQIDAQVWATDISPWNNLVESIRQSWGNVWICFHIANIASGIKSTSEKYQELSDLLDHSKDLCKRARSARLKSGQYSWWTNQIESAKSEIDTAFTLLMLVTWSSAKTLERIIPILDQSVTRLPNNIWENLYNSIENALELIPPASDRNASIDMDKIYKSLHPRTLTLICLRSKNNIRRSIYLEYLKEYDGTDSSILKLCHDMSLEFLSEDYSKWEKVRDVIQKSYVRGVVFDPYLFHRLSRDMTIKNIPDKVATEIGSNPSNYPGFLVAIAEMKLKEIVASKVVPVGETAIKDKWFDHL